MTFVDRKLGLSSNYSWLIVYPGRCTRRWRRLGSTSAVLYSSRKNKDPRAHRDGAVQFSAHECLIFNRIAAMPRWGKRKRAPWKIKFYCFLLTDKARGESSNAIDRNRSSLKQKPVQLFSFPVGRPQRHPRWLETKTNLSLLQIPFRTSYTVSSLFFFSLSLSFFLSSFFISLLSSFLFPSLSFYSLFWFFCFRRRESAHVTRRELDRTRLRGLVKFELRENERRTVWSVMYINDRGEYYFCRNIPTSLYFSFSTRKFLKLLGKWIYLTLNLNSITL